MSLGVLANHKFGSRVSKSINGSALILSIDRKKEEGSDYGRKHPCSLDDIYLEKENYNLHENENATFTEDR